MISLHYCFAILFSCSLLLSAVESYVQTQPEQVHLSLGADPTQMVVTWVTFDPTDTSTVKFGINRLTNEAYGNAHLFEDGGSEGRILYIHRVTLTDLIPGQQYLYHCGSTDGWSPIFALKAIADGSNWSPRFAVYGDLGNVNGQSIPRLQDEVQQGMYDAILHNGDFAYNMDTDNARVGDDFMRQLEPIAAYVPYQTSVGNHENAYNFSNYNNRFSMVNSGSGEMNNFFYSINVGPAHIIFFSTEFYFYIEYGWAQIGNQYRWLEKDLMEANKPENRAVRPWIITLGHRPMYCSTEDDDDCSHKESIIRKGIPIIHAYGLEDLFYKYGVDVEIWAHEHMYERMWPLYNRQVFNGSAQNPYVNPKAPVHFIAGSAGCQERLDPFVPNPPDWSAVRISDYGYTRMTVLNGTHLHLQQISDDRGGIVVDETMVVKEKHGPEAWL